MARKNNWLNHLKKFFGFERKTRQEKRNRRKGWLLRRFKSKCVPALPSRSPQKVITLQEAEEAQTKHAVAVAVATAAAAEAAVAAAQAAAQVVRLTGTPLSHQKSQVPAAAIKIQAAFRGYLARRALKALKGLVKLQALVRGQSVRRQTNITLRNLQSLMKIQSEARASRIRTVEGRQDCENKDDVLFKNNGDVKTTLKQNCERRWDSSSFSKEEIDAIIRSRVEAALKRERAMQYASRQGRKNSQRPNTPVAEELESEIMNHRWSWLEQWVGLQPCERDIHEILPVPNPDTNFTVHRVSDFRQREKAEMTQLRSLARRSFNRSRRASLRDDESCMSSPPLPSYMASTASTKSKFRSMSTPRQRLGVADTYSEHCFSYNNRLLSPITSIASDAGLSKTGKFSTNYQKSPRIKGQSPPVKSHRSSKYLSFDSECSLLN